MTLPINIDLASDDPLLASLQTQLHHDVASSLKLKRDQHGVLTVAISNLPKYKPLSIDFTDKKFYMRTQTGKNNDILFKAVKLNKHKNITVLDGTTGLGRDAFMLASYGCKMSLLERNQLLHIMLTDAISKLAATSKLSGIADNINLLPVRHNMQDEIRLHKKYDVVYLDPMFPVTKNLSLAKKEAQFLQHIAGCDPDQDALLKPAMQLADKKVVVKRAVSSCFLAGDPPSYSVKGNSVRFDVYLV